MKTLFLVRHQSFIDVITNSSSEIFLCDTKKSLDFVETFLKESLNTYAENGGSPRAYEDVFERVYQIDESNVDEFIEDYVIEWGVFPSDLKGIEAPPDYYSYYRTYRDFETGNAAFEKAKSAWKTNHYDKTRTALLGMIVIRDCGDNTIPSDMFSIIEFTLNAERRHLG